MPQLRAVLSDWRVRNHPPRLLWSTGSAPISYVPAQELEQGIWSELRRVLSAPEIVLNELREATRAEVDAGQVERLEARIASLKKREEKLVRLFSYDDVDDEVVRRELQGLQRQRTTLTDELESLPRPGASLPAGVDEAALRRICEAVAERLDGGGPEDQERVGKRRPGP